MKKETRKLQNGSERHREQTLMVVNRRFKLRKKKTLATGEERRDYTNKNCNYKIYSLQSSSEIIRWQNEYNHPAEASDVAVHEISSSCKRKAPEDLSEKPSKIICKELTNNGIPHTLKTRDIFNIKKSIYRARRKILPALPKSAEEVHESLS